MPLGSPCSHCDLALTDFIGLALRLASSHGTQGCLVDVLQKHRAVSQMACCSAGEAHAKARVLPWRRNGSMH